ncbi:hypothetical protein PSEUDO9AZ_10016 [Pseudomonas sp. 9AZ]|nr:hypothetical protein PSEUDO9AZ_10016 [Pseudomonas sp. 9AZ]
MAVFIPGFMALAQRLLELSA